MFLDLTSAHAVPTVSAHKSKLTQVIYGIAEAVKCAQRGGVG